MMDIESRPEELDGKTIQVNTACGNMFVTVNSSIRKPIFEVFAFSGKSGSCSASVVDALTKVISLALQSGVEEDKIINKLKHIGCPKSSVSENSCAEGIAKAMERYLNEEYEEIVVEIEDDDDIKSMWSGELKEVLHSNEEFDITSDGKIVIDMNKYLEEDEVEVESNNSHLEKCPECGEYSMGSGEGCGLCLNCGYSPCK